AMVAELGPDADELSTLIHRLQGEMNKAAEDLRFEEAAMLRDEIAELRALGLRDPVDGSAVPAGDGGILEETATS
ncbi:MAG: UvrB/UvrC motif-containing protein, partial [Acidimicrobiales bacterium]